jgi:ankyrin repeat protein
MTSHFLCDNFSHCNNQWRYYEDTDVHFFDKDGWTALHRAAANGHIEIVKYLFEKGGNINIPLKVNISHSAFSSSNGRGFILFFSNGRQNGLSGLHLAADNGHADVVKYLAEKISDIDAQDEVNCYIS